MINNEEYKILLVDDITANLQLLGDMIKAAGFQIMLAHSGIQALESVKAIPPDLILLDVMMPEMDGYEACKRLKADPETSDIPVIFLTAKVQSEDIVHGFNLGAVDYVSKPFNSIELLARINTHLELKEARLQLKEKNRKLEEAARLREDIELIIQHDMKSPLNSVIAFPQLLLMSDSLSVKEKQYLEMIKNSGYRLLNMINISLDLYKMETGVYQPKLVPVNIRELFLEIETELKNLLEIKSLSVQYGMEKQPAGDLQVLGEKLLCYSMFANLMKNAIEASPDEEQIRVVVETSLQNQMIDISIHNKGEVPDDMRGRFFDKYATSGKTGGTGLGTYSVKLIAGVLGGSVYLESSVTKGTTVTVSMPQA